MSNRDYDIAHIRKYVDGKLSPKEMYALERAAHADEMLMDLIIGMEHERQQQTAFPADELQTRINKRTAPKGAQAIPLWKKITVAASLLAIVSVSIYFLQHNQDKTQHVETAGTQDSGAETRDSVASKLAIADSGAKVDTANDTRLAYTPSPGLKSPAKKSPASIPDKTDQETETIDDIADKMRTDSHRLANTQTPVQMQNLDVTASHAQAKKHPTSQDGRQVIRGVAATPSANEKATVVVGKIIDAYTEQPLPHVTVKDLASKKMTQADEKGNFMILSDVDSVNLAVHQVGYKSQQIVSRTSGLEIRLEPDINTLDEVTLSVANSKTPNKSVPLIGWQAFKDYVTKRTDERKELSKGTVTLTFDVNEQGQPTNIAVEESVDSLHDRAAIDILKDGPEWRQGKKTTKVKLKIRFKK